MMTQGPPDIVRLARTLDGAVPVETVVARLSTCLDYLESRAREAGLVETAELIGVAALSARADQDPTVTMTEEL